MARVLTPKLIATTSVAFFVMGMTALAEDLKGTIKSVDRANSRIVVHDSSNDRDVTVNYTKSTSLGRSHASSQNIRDLKEGAEVTISDAVMAATITISEPAPRTEAGGILKDFWNNFKHNLFKPLLLFFYLGFLVPILKVHFEFPYEMYQALTIYLLIAIGWHGGEELSRLDPAQIRSIVGFVGVGFLTNTFIGVLSYLILSATTRMRRIDRATVAGYYGSDSAGTFVTTLGVLSTAHVLYDAYMPVMLAVMEIPGCLVALYLVARLRHSGMDPLGNMPGEPDYKLEAQEAYKLEAQAAVFTTDDAGHGHEGASRSEEEMSLEKMEHPDTMEGIPARKPAIFTAALLHEVFLNTGLYLLFGGIIIGLISGLQGPEVTRADDSFFVTLFQGILCLFLLEMGMTASRKLKDLKTAGWPFVIYGILAPNLFATVGILVAHTYAWATGTHFELGTYVLFSVLCGSASYIPVPAVQRLAIPEASPTLPLAASLGLTFSYNVTIGIPVYMEIAKVVIRSFPIS